MGTLSYLAYFLIGLFGGGHCIGMCGPFAVIGVRPGQSGQRRWFILNVFRVLGYTALGGVAGLIGAGSHGFGRWYVIQLVLYGLAQLMLIGLGLQLAGLPSFVSKIEKAGALLWRRFSPMFTSRVVSDRWYATAGAGLLWALLPCGLIYSALTGALASGDVGRGAGTMLAFAMGTLPTLLLMGRFAGELRAWLQHSAGRKVLGILIIAIGCWGIIMMLRQFMERLV